MPGVYGSKLSKGNRQEFFIQNLAQHMRLVPVKAREKTLHVRIWLWTFEKQYVIDIDSSDAGRKCGLVSFNTKLIDSNDYIVVHQRWESLFPTGGWDSFLIVFMCFESRT